MPKMDLTAPDNFRAETAMLLNPEIFQDLVSVKKPSIKMYYNPGVTTVAQKDLWRILERAQEKKIEIRSVSINPNGLGLQKVLSAGVITDISGRWTDPKIEPVNE